MTKLKTISVSKTTSKNDLIIWNPKNIKGKKMKVFENFSTLKNLKLRGEDKVNIFT